MKNRDLTHYVKNLIENFNIPQSDEICSCWFSSSNHDKEVKSAIYISRMENPKFYVDIFEFWVRSFFCFVEDFGLGKAFVEYKDNIISREDLKNEFRSIYEVILENDDATEYFLERQSYPETYVELRNREFSDAFVMLDTPDFKSYVANSNTSYVAIFRISLKAEN